MLGGEYVTTVRARAGRYIRDLLTAEIAEGAEMNGVNRYLTKSSGLRSKCIVDFTKLGIPRLVHELPG